jgi:PBSX family phage portal protein
MTTTTATALSTSVSTITELPAQSGTPAHHVEAFTFGEAEPMDRSAWYDYRECWIAGDYYEYPIEPAILAKLQISSPHHASAINLKLNMIRRLQQPTPEFSRQAFSSWALDYLIFGNAYVEGQYSRTGRLLKLQHALAMYMRRGVKLDQYFMVRQWMNRHEFAAGTVHHLIDPDIKQEIYGTPQYLAAMASIMLNNSATMFRRRYYDNGSHAGYIMYVNDAQLEQADVDALRASLRNAKGPGNFRNLFLYSPNGKKDGVQIIPISEVAAKDDFNAIKSTSRDDILAAHRVPPQLLGMVPQNSGGFGDIVAQSHVFYALEVQPIIEQMLQLNEWAGAEVLRFAPYDSPVPAPAAPLK